MTIDYAAVIAIGPFAVYLTSVLVVAWGKTKRSQNGKLRDARAEE